MNMHLHRVGRSPAGRRQQRIQFSVTWWAQSMSAFQQRWRNVYTDGSFFAGQFVVQSVWMTVHFDWQVSSRLPAPRRVMVQSKCSLELLPRRFHRLAHTVKWVRRYKEPLLHKNTALLWKCYCPVTGLTPPIRARPHYFTSSYALFQVGCTSLRYLDFFSY